MDTRKLRSLLFTSLLAAFASCGPAEQGEEQEASNSAVEFAPLEGTNWQLVQLVVTGGFVFTPEEPGKYVLNFRSENRLTGTSDCNRITGAWQQESTTLRFEPFSATRSLCEPGSLHNYLVLNLEAVVAHSFLDGRMIMTTTTEGVEIEFEPSK
ncbi:MAG: META domain-containing protein [Gammaproteobacteria bacterium]|nr:META domain-containing protein [Gammaproteobacteria bacterium]